MKYFLFPLINDNNLNFCIVSVGLIMYVICYIMHLKYILTMSHDNVTYCNIILYYTYYMRFKRASSEEVSNGIVSILLYNSKPV